MNRFLLVLLWLGLAGSAAAQWSNNADELLEPEKAFRFSARVLDGAVEVRFAIAEDGTVTGYSLTDPKGPYETKTKIEGSYNKKKGVMKFREINVLDKRSSVS